jgi:hypothetical protein
LATHTGWWRARQKGIVGIKGEGQGMNKQAKKIEVRFFETAEFHITPTDAALADSNEGLGG